MEEFEWNELVYSAKFSFEPVIGEIYHLYRDAEINFLSLIGPNEWNKAYWTFKLNSEKNGHFSMRIMTHIIKTTNVIIQNAENIING
jgi:hypothetical protein